MDGRPNRRNKARFQVPLVYSGRSVPLPFAVCRLLFAVAVTSCLFSCLHSRVKRFVFAVNRERFFSIFVWFI